MANTKSLVRKVREKRNGSILIALPSSVLKALEVVEGGSIEFVIEGNKVTVIKALDKLDKEV